VRAATAFLILLLVSLSQGCSAATSLDLWIQREGGICSDSRHDRVELISRPLVARLRGRHVTVHVLDSDDVCAYGWPNASLFVTRGLVDQLDDAELAAAIAHELGHLLSDGHVHHEDHVRTAVSLRGCAETSEELDAESEADAIAVDLLAAEGMPPDAVLRMLEKVRVAGSASPACRSAMGRRISLLSKRLGSGSSTLPGPLRSP
jgi:Zn-dependent protease with chaperone function